MSGLKPMFIASCLPISALFAQTGQAFVMICFTNGKSLMGSRYMSASRCGLFQLKMCEGKLDIGV